MRALISFVVVPIAIGVLIVLVLANTQWGNERVRLLLVSQANRRLNGQLSISGLRGHLLSSATLTGVVLVDSARHPVFTARGVQVKYGLWSALRGKVVVKSLVLDTPLVVLDKRPGARWNFQALMRPSSTPTDTSQHRPPPEIADITIRHGRFFYRRPWQPDSSLPRDKRDSAIAAALRTDARSRTERVAGGFQRIVSYHDIDARIPVIDIARPGRPTAVQIASLSMIGEPYRPPAVDVRSLVGTLYATKDSLWWRGMRLSFPGSQLVADGRVGLNKTGMAFAMVASPIALADLRWLDPKLPADGGGKLRYSMRVHGDTAEYSFADADVRYRNASVVGRGALTRIRPAGRASTTLVRGVDVTVARLSTSILHELMPSLALRRSGTLDGRVTLDGAQTALNLDADVRFDDATAGRSRVIARGGVGMVGGVRVRDLEVKLLPLRVATLEGSGVRIPLGGTVTGSALVNGALRDGWSVRGDLTHEQGGDRSRVVGTGRYQVAGKRIVADATLQPLSLATVGRFVPAAQLRGSVTGRVHAQGTTRDLQLSGTIRSTAGGGSLDGRGMVDLRGTRTRYDIAVALDALDASAFSRRAPRSRLTGSISARGTGTSPGTADAVLRVDLARSRYDTFSVDRLMARAAVAKGLLNADTIVVVASGARASASGTLGLIDGRDGTMHATLTVDSLGALRHWLGVSDTTAVAAAAGRQSARVTAARADSARRADASRIERLALGLPESETLIVDTLTPIRRDSLSGTLSAVATLRGNVKHLGVDAHVQGRDLVARGNAVASLDGQLSTPDVRSRAAPLAFKVSADSVQTGGYGLERIDASGSWHDQLLRADVRARQDSLISYAALGSYGRPAAGVQVVRLDSMSARFDTLVWRLARPGAVRLDHGSIAVDSLDLRSSAGGRLFANGVAPVKGGVHLDVAAENVRVATVLMALQRDMNADGAIGATAHITGTRAEPAIVGSVTLRDATYLTARAPDVDAALRYGQRRMTLDVSARDSSGRRVLAADAALPLDLSLEALTTSRRVAGPLVANVTLDSLSLAALPLGSRSLEDVRGSMAGEVHVRGTWRAPEYAGHAALRGGGLMVVSTGMRLADAVADLRLSGDTLHLDSLVARARGTIRADGAVAFADRAHATVRMNADVRGLRVMDATRGVLDVDGEIAAAGPLEAMRITGRVELLDGYLALKQFNKNLIRVKAPGSLSFFAVFDTTAPAGDSARRAAALAKPPRVGAIADVSVVVDRGNYYRNRPDANTGFFTEPGQPLAAHIDTRTGDMYAVGFVRIADGVAIFRASTFVPTRGSLTFAPYTNGAGYIEQVGERPVWEPGRGIFPVELLTGGTSKGPAVGLESGAPFPIRGRELNGYMTIGREHTSLLQQSGSTLSGSEGWSGQLSGETGALARRQQAATALGVVLHDIGTGATKEFGLDAFNVSAGDVPTELVFGKTGGVRGAVIEGGQYVTTDRYVAAQLHFTSGIPGLRMSQLFGTRYRLDVGLEPRFLFREPEDLGITHPTVRTGVFGAFLTRGWEW